jgi:hypothetical protein
LSKLPFAVIMKRFFDFYQSELMVWAVREPPVLLQNFSWQLILCYYLFGQAFTQGEHHT